MVVGPCTVWFWLHKTSFQIPWKEFGVIGRTHKAVGNVELDGEAAAHAVVSWPQVEQEKPTGFSVQGSAEM